MTTLDHLRMIGAACCLLAVLASHSGRTVRAQTHQAPGHVSAHHATDVPPAYPAYAAEPQLASQTFGVDFETSPGMPLYEKYGQCSDWGLHLMPDGLIYRSYLAGTKESRCGAGLVHIPDDSWMWDATIGARLGMLRLGNCDPIRPRGFQLDVETSAQLRLDIPEDVDVRAADYRVGFPLTWGNEQRQWKLAYYHMSSHLGDEFMKKNPDFPWFRHARDAFVLGHSIYLTDWFRVYGEVGWAFHHTASSQWEFQFGVDYAPRVATGLRGAPFFAVNGYLREELDFGGSFTAQAGWAWRADSRAHLFRLGFQYYNGASWQYAFLPYHEQQIGLWAWYDF